MDNTIEISDFRSHVVQEVMCWKCGKRWIAVRPEKTLLKELECPNGCERGYVFATGEIMEGE